MKKLFSLTLVIFLCLCVFTACADTDSSSTNDTAEHSGYTEDQKRWFDAEVLKISGGSMTVEPFSGTWEASNVSVEGISVTLTLDSGDTVSELSAGDTVRITYDGRIAESYPTQILTVYSIEILIK